MSDSLRELPKPHLPRIYSNMTERERRKCAKFIEALLNEQLMTLAQLKQCKEHLEHPSVKGTIRYTENIISGYRLALYRLGQTGKAA